MAVYEGFWDCRYCDTKKIRGSLQKCHNCGKTRDKDVKFYLASDSKVLSKSEASKIDKRPDWYCSYCDSYNSAAVETCKNCGSVKSSQTYFDIQRRMENNVKDKDIEYKEPEENVTPTVQRTKVNQNNTVERKSSILLNNTYNHDKLLSESISSYRPKKSNKSISHISFTPILSVLFILLMIILAVVGIKQYMSPQVITIKSFEWESTVDVEEYKTVKESDWTMPSNGRLLYTKEEFYKNERKIVGTETKEKVEYEKVQVGTKEEVVGKRDLGNGYFEDITEEVPVYENVKKVTEYEEPIYENVPINKTKYYYEIDKWVYSHSEKETGKDKNPYYPNVSYNKNQREKSSNISYYVICVNEDNETQKYSTSKEIWYSLEANDTVECRIVFDNIVEIIKKDQ